MCLSQMSQNTKSEAPNTGDGIQDSQSLDEDIQIITSTDGPFELSDAIKRNIAVAQKHLLVSAPWVSKTFIDFLRILVPRDVTLYILTRMPENSFGRMDYSFYALDSLLGVANEKGWRVSVKCNQNIHVKFIVVDDLTCLFGTANPTDAGIYYN